MSILSPSLGSILIVGGGAMGTALAEGWRSSCSLTIVDPAYFDGPRTLEELASSYQPDSIVFAVKPQILPKILPLYAQRFSGAVWISVAAGIPLALLRSALGEKEIIVRAMPNLAAQFAQGMTALVSDRPFFPDSPSPLLLFADNLFRRVGKVVWLEKETLINAATAISGSGPAYFYALIDTLIDSGVRLGLPLEVSTLLATQTAIGVGYTLEKERGCSPQVLKERVTSPGGTTEAALKVLEDNLKDLMGRTTVAAWKKSSSSLF